MIAGATVTALNTKTEVTSTFSSNAQGIFVFASLQPGTYTVTVEANGFRKSIISNVELNVGETVSQVVKLEIGVVSESVTVEADAVRVQITESAVSKSVTLRDIDTLPQLARGPMSLSLFTSGVQIDTSSADGSYSKVNGMRQGSNNTTLDGIDVNDHVAPRLGLSMTPVNTDSVAEFRMITSGGKAEYGRNAGGQVEMITRSGTNEWHGNTFDYLRNTILNANTFVNNSSNQSRPVFIQNIFGGSLGGPIRHNKTFVFGNYQGRRTNQQSPRNRTVLTPTAKKGIFQWNPTNGGPLQSYDIFANDPRHIGLDKEMAKYVSPLPDPNNTLLGDGLNTAGYQFNAPNNSREDQFTIKVDHNVKDTLHTFFRWTWGRTWAVDSANSNEPTFPGQPAGWQGGRRYGYSGGADWTINNTMINQFRFGRQKANTGWNNPSRLQGPMATGISSFTSPLNDSYFQGRSSPVNEFTDNLSIVRGTHTLKMGANIRFLNFWQQRDDYIWPSISLTTGNGNTVPVSLSNIASADKTRFENMYNELLGRMSQSRIYYISDLQKFQPAGTPREHTLIYHEYGYFFQDDWKIRPNLTLNLGVRWEFFGVPYEKDGLQGVLDKAGQINSISQFNDSKVVKSSRWYNDDKNNFAPRIGLVWSPGGDGKTAVRAFYGVFYDRMIGSTSSAADRNFPGFSYSGLVYPNSGGTDVRMGDGIPVAAMPAAPVLQLPATRSMTTVNLLNPDLRTGYVHSYSLSIQRELLRNTVLDVAYVANRGVKLFMNVNYASPHVYGDFLTAFKEIQANRANGAAVPANNMLLKMFGSVSSTVSALGASVIDQGRVGQAAESADTSYYTKYAAAGLSDYTLRSFPQVQQLVVGTNNGRSYYDSLQVSLRRQVGSLKFNANYTFSKALDNGSAEGNGFTTPIDNYNLALNKGRGDSDRPHVFNGSLTYTLPIGKGHRFAGSAPRWVDSLIGGWDVGLLSIWQSGSALSISSGRATGPVNTNSRANYTGDRNFGSVMRKGDGVYFFTPEQIANFSYPLAGEIGNSGRNAFRGPRYFNLDASIVKRFKVTEQKSFMFRAEAYNFLNNVNFTTMGTTMATMTSLGKFSATTQARVMQAALRFDF